MNLTDNNTTYIIPLDAIDLNYITKTNFSNGSVPYRQLPVWNGSNHSAREYYEFEIMAQKKQESSVNENGDCLNDPKYQCHVCDINVPLGYKKQHASSLMHKACLKILETAMDRTKKLLQAKDDDDSVTPALDSYFCEHCSVAVNTSKREDHDLSKDHFKSLKHDIFLNDLLMIYVDKSNLENLDLEYMSKANINSKKQNCDSICNVDSSMSSNDEQNDDFMNLVEYRNEANDKKASSGKDEKNLEVNEEKGTNGKHDIGAINVKKYIEILASSSHSSLSPKLVVKGDKLEVETSDKSVIYVSEDHFHGFSKNNNGDKIHCKLCDVVFVNEVRHKMSPEHMKKVLTPISNMHGIRQVNQLNKHCVLCNVSVHNIEEHKTSDYHIDTLRKALSKNVVKYDKLAKSTVTTLVKNHKENVPAVSTEKTNTTLPNAKNVDKNTANELFCATCKIYLHTNNIMSHFYGKRHKRNLADTERNKSVDGQTKTPVTNDELNTGGLDHKSKLFTLTDIEGIVYTSTETGKVCRICNVSVPTNEKNLTEHSSNHSTTFENVVSKYKIVKLNNRLVCGKCGQQFDVKSFFDHIQTHEGVKEEAKKLRLCRICNIQVIDTHEDFFEHKYSEYDKIHYNNLKEYLYPHLMPVLRCGPDDLDDTLFCKVCDIYIDTLESKAHVESPSHLQIINSLLHENKVLFREDFFICTLCSLVMKSQDVIIHINDPDHKIRKNSIDNYDSIKCIFCNVLVPYSQGNIKIHENGRRHKMNFKNIVELLNFDKGSSNRITHISGKPKVDYLSG